jgi:LysM repeat protein
MYSAERSAGLLGSLCIILTLVGLAVWRFSYGPASIDLPQAEATPTRKRPTPTATSSPTSVPLPAVLTPTVASLVPGGLAVPVVVENPEPVVHVISQGEDLYRIALYYGVPLPALAAANHITDTSQIIAGQVLTIPLTPPPKALPTAGPSPTRSPTSAVKDVLSINGLALPDFVLMTEQVRQNIRRIYRLGQALGNRPNAFSSVGDSTIEYPYFMTGFDHPGHYVLGPYGNLQVAIAYFAGSFDRQSMGVMRGLRASTALDPFWADKAVCNANESRISCEYRLNKPAIVFIRLGSNEGQPKAFDKYLRLIVDYWVAHGVVPIMGTKADRVEGPDNADNQIIRQIAVDYQLPLWDFDLIAQTVPGGVVGHDGIHLTSYASYDFSSAEAFQRGYGLHNLTALIALNEVWQVLSIDTGAH